MGEDPAEAGGTGGGPGLDLGCCSLTYMCTWVAGGPQQLTEGWGGFSKQAHVRQRFNSREKRVFPDTAFWMLRS